MNIQTLETMPRSQEPIVIQEPPLQELGKKRSCLKRTCATGCGCIILFLIASFFLLKLIAIPKEKPLNELPEEVKQSVPLYDTDSIVQIVTIPGKRDHSTVDTLALVPKAVLGPIFLSLDEYVPEDRERSSWKAIKTYLQEPVVDRRDFYTIEWHDLDATSKFIYDYYGKELRKRDFTLEMNDEKNSIIFSKSNTNGTITIDDIKETKPTDKLIMKLYLTPSP